MECGRVAIDFRDGSPRDEFGRTQHELAAVARFDPSRLAFESHRARAQGQPAVFAEDQLHAVCIARHDLTIFGRVVFNGRRSVGAERPLAEINAVRTPFQYAAADQVRRLFRS